MSTNALGRLSLIPRQDASALAFYWSIYNEQANTDQTITFNIIIRASTIVPKLFWSWSCIWFFFCIYVCMISGYNLYKFSVKSNRYENSNVISYKSWIHCGLVNNGFTIVCTKVLLKLHFCLFFRNYAIS